MDENIKSSYYSILPAVVRYDKDPSVFIENALSKLNEIETKIIKDRFFKNKTQMHVANDLGVSQMTVSRMEKKLLAKLKKDYEKSLY